MAKKLWSVFTDDMDHCFLTASPIVERHHIFGGFNRKRSEVYGYVIPLHPSYHPNGVHAPAGWQEIDLKLKQMAQQHYEANHGTRENFIQEFGRNYL